MSEPMMASMTLAQLAEMVRPLEAERDALRAMLDEILALEDVETPSRDGSETVASAVGDALGHLRAERDEYRQACDRAIDAVEYAQCERDKAQRDAKNHDLHVQSLSADVAAQAATIVDVLAERDALRARVVEVEAWHEQLCAEIVRLTGEVGATRARVYARCAEIAWNGHERDDTAYDVARAIEAEGAKDEAS